jgi:hypothetical protein
MTALSTEDFWIGVAIVCSVIWTASPRSGSTFNAVTWLAVAAVFAVIRAIDRRRARKKLLDALAKIDFADKTAQQPEEHRP